MNQPLPTNASLDPGSAGMVAALNAGQHNANYGEYGTTVFNAAGGSGLSKVVCTETGWGRCPVSGSPMSTNPGWRPSSGSDHAMIVIDYAARKVYDLWRVATNPDGTVALSGDGTLNIGWGDVTSLDGSGQSFGATGSGLSHLYGMVRIFEAQNAVDAGGCSSESSCRLGTAISHALHLGTNLTCPTFRSPAAKSDGNSSGPGCVPAGARLFLDQSANCAFDPTKPIEEAVCFALKRYGAFVSDSADARFAVGFEGASAGVPGGSGSEPYVRGGLKWDYYNMQSIPWQYLRVAAG